MTWSRIAARVAASLVLALCASTALADPPKPPKGEAAGRGGKSIQMRMMVTRLSNDGRGVDPKAKELESKLSSQGIRFDSAEVLQKKQIEMGAGEVHTIDLPNGRKARVQPLHQGKDGVLMAVDVEGSSKADVRARPNHTVIFSAGPFRDGKLVLSLEPVESKNEAPKEPQ
ncbi:MAG TPA: hypothetical protein VMW19_00725 [Myxococcota bacterium]|nr:hypothetical protein [Myxococcota bacterium]